MFFAQNNIRHQFELYLTFLGEIVEHNNENYKSYFHPILHDTQKLCSGELTYSGISRDHFDVIAVLANNHKEYFRNITVDNLSIDNYRQIQTFLLDKVKSVA